MAQYAVFLRGINVGRANRIKICDIVPILCRSFDDVRWYGQSGNFVFCSDMKADDIVLTIESDFEKEFGFNVFCIVRTVEELQRSVGMMPFPDAPAEELFFVFMNEHVTHEEEDEWTHKEDRAKRIGDVVYLHCRGQYHRTGLSNGFFEKELDVICTTRGLNTVNAVLGLIR
jgi:uncharacterized protein (DUF1697 family)